MSASAADLTLAQLQEKFEPASCDWGEPEPLRRELPPPDPFPVDALGGVLGNAVRAVGETIQSPAALRAQSFLAAAALAVQGHADIVIHGRRFPVSEFFITVGESGERKSATDDCALSPHYFRQRELMEKAAKKRADHDADHLAWKRARDEALSQKNEGREAKKKAVKAVGDEPRMILAPILLTTEPTYEGLVKALAEGWPSMGLFSDEGGRFIGGHAMSVENRLKTAAGLSELWGGKPISRTRGGDGNSLICGRRVSLHLMVQPSVSAELLGDPTLQDQGLLSRTLVVRPESTIGTRDYKEADPYEQDAMKKYFARMLEVLREPLPTDTGALNELKPSALEPRTLAIASDALKPWIGFHDHIEHLMAPDRELAPIRGLAAKAAEHALRLAGILALVDDIHAHQLSEDNVKHGIDLAQYYLNEALRLYHSAADDPDLVLAEKCLRWGRAQPCGRFAAVTLYQRGPNAIRDKRTAERVLDLLAEHGWARQLPPGTEIDGKRRGNAWEVR